MVLKKPKIGTGNAEAASPRGRIFQARQGIGKAFDESNWSFIFKLPKPDLEGKFSWNFVHVKTQDIRLPASSKCDLFDSPKWRSF